MHFEFANLLVFMLLAAGFVVVNMLVGRFLRPKSAPREGKPSEPGKLEIYECGEPTIGPAWIRFDIRFYTVALMFVVFDVEIALLFPWAAVFRDLVAEGMGTVALVEAGTFIAILMVGLAYVWARGDIDWTATESVSGERVPDERSRVTIDDQGGRRAAPAQTAAVGRDDA